MAKRKFEDILDELRDAGVDDELMEELDAFKGSSLRQRAERSSDLESENDSLKARIKNLEEAPLRAKAFEDYGINLADLRPAEREALEAADPGEDGFTPEWVGSLAEKYDLVVDQGSEGEAENEEPPAAEIARQARASGQRSDKTTIKPDEARTWAPDVMLRFKEANPDAWESLKRGESVVGVPPPA